MLLLQLREGVIKVHNRKVSSSIRAIKGIIIEMGKGSIYAYHKRVLTEGL